MRTGTKPTATKTNYVTLPGIPSTQKNTAGEFNWLVDKATNPQDIISFTVSVKADDEYSFADYTQTGVLNFVKDGSVTSGGIGNGMSGVIVCNGSAINFSADFDVIRNDEFAAASRYFVDFKWNGAKFVTTIKKVGVNVYGAGIGEAPIDGNQYARKNAGWEQVVASGGPAIENRYATIAAMLAGQASQNDKGIQFVTDASTDTTVDAGYAYYEYLGTTNGNITDYRKLSEQESMDIDLTVYQTKTDNDLTTTSKQIDGAINELDAEIASIQGDQVSLTIFKYSNTSGAL